MQSIAFYADCYVFPAPAYRPAVLRGSGSLRNFLPTAIGESCREGRKKIISNSNSNSERRCNNDNSLGMRMLRKTRSRIAAAAAENRTRRRPPRVQAVRRIPPSAGSTGCPARCAGGTRPTMLKPSPVRVPCMAKASLRTRRCKVQAVATTQTTALRLQRMIPLLSPRIFRLRSSCWNGRPLDLLHGQPDAAGH